ncbi:tetratricopeptide repeat protein [Rhodospirillales bacterium]|nr:tetratricopeptide repeat protein [Rhodospirillales bacterium]
MPTQAEIQQDNLDSRAKQLVRMADTTRESGDMANAMQLYARAADMRQDWVVPRQRLGETALSVGQYPDALMTFESAAQLAPKDNRGHNSASVVLDLMGMHDEAQQRYISGMEQAPDNGPLRNNLGLSLALSGDYEAAIELLESAVTRQPDDVRTRQNLALVYGLSGNDNRARLISADVMSKAVIDNNIAFYAKLRNMSPADRTKAVFGILK